RPFAASSAVCVSLRYEHGVGEDQECRPGPLNGFAAQSRPQMLRRLDYLVRFYRLLETLERRIGGSRTLADCHGRMLRPQRGVYFFMEAGERRTETGNGLRIVRVGTHALKPKSQTTLLKRLSQHKGQQGVWRRQSPRLHLQTAGRFNAAESRRHYVSDMGYRQLGAARSPYQRAGDGAAGQAASSARCPFSGWQLMTRQGRTA